MKKQPNILLIVTDQQSATMMSCAGNKYLSTPAMDSMAGKGTRFDLAFASNPVCAPARFTMFTGLYPSAIGMRANGRVQEYSETIKQNGLGNLLRNAGYETAYGGKEHLPKTTAEELGFEKLSHDERDELAEVSAEFIKKPHDKPFFLTCSLINPHDICYMAIRDNKKNAENEAGIIERGQVPVATMQSTLDSAKDYPEDVFWDEKCPPLPDNHEVQEDEPELIETGLLTQRPFRKNARDNWDEEKWRMHRWAYVRLTEIVDKQIQTVLDAVEESGEADNTVIIFTSDHGDHDSSHKLEHKTILYEEASRIPFIIVEPGKKPTFDTEHLCSLIDLLPTICDYAGAAVPETMPGLSIKPLVGGDEKTDWREHLLIECEIGYGIRTKDYLYTRYDSGKNNEQLYDMIKDPGQTKNFANEPELKEQLNKMSKLLDQQV